MKITGSNVVPFEVERVWDSLLDPRVLVATIPGCERLETLTSTSGAEHAYDMTVTAGVASIRGTYQGSCTLSDLVEHRSLLMRLTGAGAPGTIDASVQVWFGEADAGQTKIDYEADAIVGGMVGGVGFVVGRAVIRDLYDGPRAQRMMAHVAVIFAIAPAVAPVIGGQLLRAFDWHGVFFFLALVAAVLFAAAWRYLPETLPRESRLPFAPQPLWRGYRDIFGSGQFVCLSLALSTNFAGFFVYVLSSPVFLIRHLGLAPDAFAWMFIPMVGGMMLGSLLNGRLAGRLSPRRTIAAGYGVMAAGAALNIATNLSMPPMLPWAILPLFVYMVGLALTMPCLQLLAMDLFPARHGMASSCQGLVQSGLNAWVAGLVAPLLWGSTMTLALGMLAFMLTGACSFALALRLRRDGC